MILRGSQEIPPAFYSDGNNEKFKECSSCKKALSNEIYRIEKAFRKYPNTHETFTVYESAICMDCQEEMLNEISEESMQKIQSYAVQNQVQIEQVFALNSEHDASNRLERCSFNGDPVSQMEEYNIIGLFKGDKMIQLPFLIGEKAMEEYAELISEETKDFLDDFIDRINNLPPSLKQLFKTKRVSVFT